MVGYRRNFVPGGTYFFTVTLADRRSSALVDHIAALRAAFRAGRRERPFTIDAIVILPDHLHSIFTLPPGDADFSGRWRRIKGHFSNDMIAAGAAVKTPSERRICPLAKTVLGAHHSQRRRLCAARRLHSFQSGQARPRVPRPRLAVFVVSPVCATGIVGRGLGRRRQRGWPGLWRAPG